MTTLHIYAQETWHDDAYIGGTRECLEMLRKAIDEALESGYGQKQMFTSDGEGYKVNVVLMSETDAERMCVPYTDLIASGSLDGAQFGPWTLLLHSEKANDPGVGAGHHISPSIQLDADSRICQCRQCLRDRQEMVCGWPAEFTHIIACQHCGNKRCPCADNHRNACTGSNEVVG